MKDQKELEGKFFEPKYQGDKELQEFFISYGIPKYKVSLFVFSPGYGYWVEDGVLSARRIGDSELKGVRTEMSELTKKKFFVDQQVRVTKFGKNASELTRKLEELPVNGVYSNPNWNLLTYTIESKPFKTTVGEAYRLSHKGKTVGFVYTDALEEVSPEFPKKMYVRDDESQKWTLETVVSYAPSQSYPFITIKGEDTYLGYKEAISVEEFGKKFEATKKKLLLEEIKKSEREIIKRIKEEIGNIKRLYSDNGIECNVVSQVSVTPYL